MRDLDGLLDEFLSQGYTIARGVFSCRQVATMRDALVPIEREGNRLVDEGKAGEHQYCGSKIYVVGSEGNAQLHRANWVGNASPELLALSRDSDLTAIVAHLLGSDEADHLLNNVHFKPPHGGEAFALHQDWRHRDKGEGLWTDLNGRGSYVQAIAAIDACDPENGTIYFQPYGGRELFDFPRTLEEQRAGGYLSRTVPAILEPGDVAFFGPYVPHWSPENGSPRPRRVLINGFAYPGANTRTFDIPNAGARISLR